MQLKSLEAFFGTPLFLRRGRYLELTDTGKLVYDYAEDTWTRVATSASPGPVGDHAMAYDPLRAMTFLYGGAQDLLPLDGESEVRRELWAFDGTDWRRVGP